MFFVRKILAPFTLFIVFLSILSILIGIIKSSVSPISLPICIIEKDQIKHLLKSSIMKNDVGRYCHSNSICDGEICPLRQALCINNLSGSFDCTDINNVYLINGISGLKNSQFENNFRSMYMKEGETKSGMSGS